MSPRHRVLAAPHPIFCLPQGISREHKQGSKEQGEGLGLQIPNPTSWCRARSRTWGWRRRAVGRAGRAARCSQGCPCSPCRCCRGSQNNSRSLWGKEGVSGSLANAGRSAPLHPYRGTWGGGSRGAPGAICLQNKIKKKSSQRLTRLRALPSQATARKAQRRRF